MQINTAAMGEVCPTHLQQVKASNRLLALQLPTPQMLKALPSCNLALPPAPLCPCRALYYDPSNRWTTRGIIAGFAIMAGSLVLLGLWDPALQSSPSQ